MDKEDSSSDCVSQSLDGTAEEAVFGIQYLYCMSSASSQMEIIIIITFIPF